MATVPMTVIVACVLLIVGLIIFLVGFFSPYWIYIEYHPARTQNIEGHFNFGLWTYCYDTGSYIEEGTRKRVAAVDDCWSLLKHESRLNDEMRVAQFFDTVGFLLVVASLVLLLITFLVGSCNQRRILPILSAVFCLAAAGSIILGAIIFGTADSHKNNLSWAFALSIVGGIIFGVAGVFIIIGAIIKK